MKKILISMENINDYIKDNKIIIMPNMIIPPSIKDYLKNNKIKISYEKSEYKEVKTGCLKERIKTILKKEYKIVDTKTIDKIISKVEEII